MKKHFFLLFCLNVIGQSLGYAQDQTNSKPQIDSLKKVIESNPHDTTMAWTYFRLAESYRATGNDEDYNLGNKTAAKCYAFAKDALQKNTSLKAKHSLHNVLGHVSRLLVNTYSWFQKNEQLEVYFKDCIDHYDAEKNIPEKCNCMRDFGRYHMVNGQQEIGREYYDNVISIERKEKDSVGLSTSLASLANLCWRNGNMSEANQFINESINILYNLEDYNKVVLMLNQSGLIYSKEGKYLEANNRFYEALEISDSINNKEGKASALNNLSVLHMRYENYEKALDFSIQGLNICKEINHQRGMSHTYNQIAGIYSELKEFDKALINYEQSLKIVNDFGRGEDIARLKLNIASTYLKVDSLRQAELLYNDIFDIIDQIKNKALLMQVRIGRGRLYLKQGKINDALFEAEKGASLLKQVDDINEARKIEKLLSSAYEQKRNWQAALVHFKNYTALNDSIINIKALRKSLSVDAEYKIKRNQDSTQVAILQKENEILENRSKIDTLKQETKIKTYSFYAALTGCLLILIIVFLWLRSFKKNKEFKELEMQQEIDLKMKEIDLLQTSLKIQSEQRTALKTDILDGSINQFLSTPLSSRELEVLVELTKGRSNKAIAENLFVSINTVRTHLSSIYEKLEVKNRMQAVNKASNLKQTSIRA